ncbi:LpxI family protein [Stieleria marina]|uniref:LpxI family protein n=1 Tax=Stieleria marina TaxID=1930275 RepID=UPI003AF35005
MKSSDSPSPIGLVAGWGSFPVEVAQQIVGDGGRVCCVAIKGHASTDLESICDHVKWMGVGKIGGHIRYFQRRGVQQVTMAGKLFKSDILFHGSVWLKHLPDWTAIKTFGPHLMGRNRDSRDDNLLMAVTNAYSNGRMTVCAATDFAPELLVKQGLLSGSKPSAKLQTDIDSGWQVAKQMGGMDIGQTITIKDGTVIAVEAIEGTDACIERTGQLCRRGGWTLVKVSKPDQDMRFDVPTIGPQTVQSVRDAGGTAIAIEADLTILVDRERTLQLAQQAGITIVAIDSEQIASNAARAAA